MSNHHNCETIKVEHVVGEKCAQVVVKQEFTIPEPKPDVEQIISVEKTVKVINTEVIKNKVIVDGQLNLQIVYVAALPDQPVHHTHATIDFTHFVELPGAEPGLMARVDVSVEDVQAHVKPHKVATLDIAAVLRLCAKVTKTEEISVLVKPPEGVNARTEKIQVEEVVAEGMTQTIVSGRFDVPPEKPVVDKILDVTAEVTITDTKILDNKVIIEGDVTLHFIYVALEATQPVHHMHQVLQFTEFVEVPGATSDMHVQVDVMITDISTKIHNKDTVGAEVIMDIVAKVTQTKELTVVTDISDNHFEKKCFKVEHVVGENRTQTVVRETVDVPEQKPGIAKVLDLKIVKVNIPQEDIVVVRDKVILSGIIEFKVLYVSEKPSQAVHAMEGELKFRNFVPVPGAKPDQAVLVQSMVEHAVARADATGGKVNIEIVLKLTARVVETTEICVVLCEEVPQPCPPGTTTRTYVIQPGDTFWKLSQRFHVSVNAIIRANPGVDPNNLQVGTTIVIPCDP